MAEVAEAEDRVPREVMGRYAHKKANAAEGLPARRAAPGAPPAPPAVARSIGAAAPVLPDAPRPVMAHDPRVDAPAHITVPPQKVGRVGTAAEGPPPHLMALSPARHRIAVPPAADTPPPSAAVPAFHSLPTTTERRVVKARRTSTARRALRGRTSTERGAGPWRATRGWAKGWTTARSQSNKNGAKATWSPEETFAGGPWTLKSASSGSQCA